MSAATSAAIRAASTIKAPPHSFEAEQGVLGAMLSSPQIAIEEVADKLSGDAFFIPAHQIIFPIVVELWEEKKAIDLITLTQVLRDRNLLDIVGGPVAVTELAVTVSTAAMLGYHVEIVIEKFQRREVIRIATDLIRRAYEEEGGDTKQLLDDGQAAFTNLIQETSLEEASQQIGPAIEAAYEQIVNAYKNRGKPTGLETGFYDLDRMTGGLKPGQLVVIAARPAMGKSAIAMNIVEHIGVEQKNEFNEVQRGAKPVQVFSLEMSREELAERLLCSRSKIAMNDIRLGFMTKDAPEKIIWPVAQALYLQPIYIDPTPGLRLHELRARMRTARTKRRVELFVIDYLQLLTSMSRRSQENRVQEVGEITRELKKLAKELTVPVILLAQVNREAEKRNYGRPKLSDLRESGDVEQDADIVLFVWRPIENINKESSDDRAALAKYVGCEESELDQYSQLIVAKHRNGAVGPTELMFDGPLTRFRNMTAKAFSNNPEERQR